MDLCFELATQIMSRLGGAVTVIDEVYGFAYFDDRDPIGFVDGTENPVGDAAADFQKTHPSRLFLHRAAGRERSRTMGELNGQHP